MDGPERLRLTYNGADAVENFIAQGLMFYPNSSVDIRDLYAVLAKQSLRFGRMHMPAFDPSSRKSTLVGVSDFQDEHFLTEEMDAWPPAFSNRFRIADDPAPRSIIHADIYFDIIRLDEVVTVLPEPQQ